MPDSEYAIVVENLGKRFAVRPSAYNLLTEEIGRLIKGSFKDSADGDYFWALNDVSFSVKKSSVVGIIGGNGSGKSTLLKVLSRITQPTRGRVVMHGRVSSMIELNVGFHPELTGRENIYLLGTILGLRTKEIDESFEQIVDFAEIGHFLDTAVKHYSSGMFLRLGFAVAAHLRPDILLVDEVLAVGDAAFQQKCIARMHDVAKQGRTVLFVSHQLEIIRQLCDRCIVLNKGVLVYEGNTEDAIGTYIRALGLSDDATIFQVESDPDLPLQVTKARIVGQDMVGRRVFKFDEPIILDIDYVVTESRPNLYIEFNLNHSGEKFYRSWDTDLMPELLNCRNPGEYTCQIELPSMLLKPGTYTAGFQVTDKKTGIVLQELNHILTFEVQLLLADTSQVSFAQACGTIALPPTWRTSIRQPLIGTAHVT